MDLLLASPRVVGPARHPAREVVRALATDLARAGHRVRWLAPRATSEPPLAAVSGVQMLDVPTDVPPFRRVQDRLTDLPTERVLSAELRDDPPDLVHVHGFGGAVSYLLPWLADRLGVPAVVVVEPLRESVCHRGTLIDHAGQPCGTWTDPRRCATCCRTAGPGGLGRGAALLAALARVVGPFAPFPTPGDFANRIDMIVQGLASAQLVCVADAMAAAALERSGVPRRALRIGIPGPDAAAWSPVYGALRRSAAAAG